MPRRSARHSRLWKPWPLTFSPFARSVAHVAASYMAKHQLQRNPPQNAADYRFIDNTLNEKNEEFVSSEEEEFEGVVQADFAFFDPKSDDFHGVKMLMQSYLDNKQWDLSGFVDLILAQTSVGTVVKIEGEEDEGLFSVISALNLGRYKDHKCIMELKEFLLKVCQEKDVINHFRSLLGEQAHNVGLLVSQRVMNLPSQLLPPLYDALFDEVSWATEDEPTEERKRSFSFKSYILISKIYKPKNITQRRRLSSDNEEAIIYTKPEDEIFHQLSSCSFSFALHTQQTSTHELKDYRLMGLVMVVEADKISSFQSQLHSLINE
ncbi:BCIP domain-containing protein [Cephalotus follicularis]|uniref:Protein BCCIP homolog n=1 Tax=Cephalotus follicularis TaxID=3775 RepID=A0A1Q3B6N9_CEPFO|nr:BCIP domain-containing protein [Cephalotus follicularis]